MITTDLPHRTEMTMRAMREVTTAGEYKIDNFVLSIDIQPGRIDGYSRTKESSVEAAILRSYGESLGWQVITGECTGHRAMLNNIRRGLSLITEDNLFYCEDHVFIERVPPPEVLCFLFENAHTGWICYNTHVHQENLLNVPGFVESPDRSIRMKYINDSSKWHRFAGEEFMIKGPQIRDEYYLNFPAAITQTDVFIRLMKYGLKHYSDVGIEIGFTNAWFDLQYDRSQQVAIYVKPGTIALRPFENFKQMHNQACMRFRNNDPSMIHPSVVPHQSCPQQSNHKRSFF